jgi:hypothetical protein
MPLGILLNIALCVCAAENGFVAMTSGELSLRAADQDWLFRW